MITDGFYECDRKKKTKPGYAIARPKKQLTIMAGLWDV